MKKNQEDALTKKVLNDAAEYVKKKAYRKNSSIVILDDNKLYLLDKNNNRTLIKSVKNQ